MGNTNTQRWIAGFYRLFLGLWVGAMVMAFIAAAVTFATLMRWEPDLGRRLAGDAVGHVLRGLDVVQAICAVVVVVCLLMQKSRRGAAHWLRVGCIAGAILFGAVNAGYFTPRVRAERRAVYDPALNSAQQAAAREQMMVHHRWGQWLLSAATLLLITAALASPFAEEKSS